MGSRWTVLAYVWQEYPLRSGYEYVEVYASQRLMPALLAARRAKREGAGCVRLEWR